jgi:hypothetical protein
MMPHLRPALPMAVPFLLVCALGIVGLRCSSQEPQSTVATGGLIPDTKPAPIVRWVDATVPQGTVLSLKLVGRIDPASSRSGDMFRARLDDAVMVGNMVVIPAGSFVEGVLAPGPAQGGAIGSQRLGLKFQTINTPTGAGAVLDVRLQPSPRVAGVWEEGTPLPVVLQSPLQIKVKQ